MESKENYFLVHLTVMFSSGKKIWNKYAILVIFPFQILYQTRTTFLFETWFDNQINTHYKKMEREPYRNNYTRYSLYRVQSDYFYRFFSYCFLLFPNMGHEPCIFVSDDMCCLGSRPQTSMRNTININCCQTKSGNEPITRVSLISTNSTALLAILFLHC